VLPDGVVGTRQCVLLANRGRTTKLSRLPQPPRRGGPDGASRARERGRSLRTPLYGNAASPRSKASRIAS